MEEQVKEKKVYIYNTKSLSVKLPTEIYDKLKDEARSQKRNVNNFVNMLFEERYK